MGGILKDTLDLLNEHLGTDFGIAVTDLESARKMARNKEVSGVLSLSPAAAERLDLIGTASHKSLSQLLKESLEEKVRDEVDYGKARKRQLQHLRKGLDLGSMGKVKATRDDLHAR